MNKSSDLTNIMSMPPSCWWEHAIVYHNQTIITIIVIFHLSLKTTLRQEIMWCTLKDVQKTGVNTEEEYEGFLNISLGYPRYNSNHHQRNEYFSSPAC